MLACGHLNSDAAGVNKYASEPPISAKDREAAKSRAKARKSTLYALTIVCHNEADQKKLFNQATRTFPGRRIRVVVS